jgi:hypothetical protein
MARTFWKSQSPPANEGITDSLHAVPVRVTATLERTVPMKPMKKTTDAGYRTTSA